jgi:hypothetical protein
VPDAYRAALARADGLCAPAGLAPHAHAALARVCERVHAAPLPEAYGDVAFVCERVERALAPRPFLALAVNERPALAATLEREAAECGDWAPRVLADLRGALAPRADA